MKKLISLLTTISVISGSASAVVSCGSASYAGVEGQKVLVVSDSGPKTDKSFNQSSYEGMLEWAKENVTDTTQDYTKNFVQPSSADSDSIKQALKSAERFKPNALVLSGGTFSDVLDAASGSVAENGKILWVDGTEDAAKAQKNVIAISFQSEVAGFEAGYAAVKEFLNMDTNANADHVNIGTYGGGTGNLPYAVTNYMWGLALGAMYYGESVGTNDDAALTKITVTTGEPGKSYVVWTKPATPNPDGIKDADTSYIEAQGNIDGFTGDFAQGSTGSNSYVSKYKSNDINFVVAGPQVADLLTAIKDDKNKYVVGVDVDQAAQYTDYKDHFLFSAGKDIKSAVTGGLSDLDSLNQKDGNPGKGIDGNLLQDSSWSKLITSDNNVVKSVDDYTSTKILSDDDKNSKAAIISTGFNDAVNATSKKDGQNIALSTITDTIAKLLS